MRPLSTRLSYAILIFACFLLSNRAWSQVAIGTSGTSPTPNSKAVLLLEGNNQGLILPIVSNLTSIGAASNEKGMVVFNSTDNKVYYFDGASWAPVGSGGTGSNLIQISGNTITLGVGASSVNLATGFSNSARGFLYWNGTSWVQAQFTLPSTTQALVYNPGTSSWGFQTLASVGGISTLSTSGTYLTVSNPTGPTATITASPITNTDISATAAIAGSKITPAFGTQNISTTGTLTTGAATVSGLTIGTSLWPANASGVLTNNGTGTLSWAPAPNPTLGGDLSGTASAATVARIQGQSISATAPTAGQVLQFVSGAWTPANLTGGGTVTNVTSTGPINVANGTTTPALTLSPLVDADISATAAIAGTKINPAFGTQNITTTTGSASIGGGLNVGLANGFTINNAGNITRINGATTSFPAANAAGVLTNDGTGTLTWAAGSGWGFTGNAGTNPATNFIGTTDAQDLVFRTNNTEFARLTSAGKFGIGTNSPSGFLDVRNASASGNAASFNVSNASNTSSAVVANKNGTSGAAYQALVTGGAEGLNINQNGTGYALDVIVNNASSANAAIIASHNGTGSVITANSAGTGSAATLSITNSASPATALSVTTVGTGSAASFIGGNVGIGTVSPISKLDVSGDLHLSQITAPAPVTDKLYNVGGNLFWNGTNISAGGSGWGITGNAGINPATNFIGTTDAQPLRFATGVGGTERMRIDATGNVGIGTTAPSYTVDVRNDVDSRTAIGVTNRTAGVNAFAEYRLITDQGPNAIIYKNSSTRTADGGANTLTVRNDGGDLHLQSLGGFNTSSFGITVQATTGNVGIANDAPASKLDVGGDIRLAQITAPAPTTDKLYNVGGSLFWNGTNISSGGSGWALGGNTGTVDGIPGTGTNYIGTTNNVPLNFMVNNTRSGRIDPTVFSTFFGFSSGQNNGGVSNTGMGNFALSQNTSGSGNTGVGASALSGTTLGNDNTAVGNGALFFNSTGSGNAAFGQATLSNSSTASGNTAIGNESLRFTSTGLNNTALGGSSGVTNTTGSNNTFLGSGADATVGNLTKATAIGFNAKVATSNSLVLGGTGVDAVNVGIGITSPVSKLDVAGDVRLAQITAPAPTTDKLYNVGGSLFWNGTNISSGGSSWTLGGTPSTIDGIPGTGTNYIGTSNNVPLNFMVNNQRAGRIEVAAGTANSFYGYQSGNVNTGIDNSAFGYQALALNTSGLANTAVGKRALNKNTTSNNNTAVGTEALFDNVVGGDNTAVGVLSLSANTANRNTALGAFSMQSSTGGADNVGIGSSVLNLNTTGSLNTAVGSLAGRTATPANANTTGSANTFIGYASGPSTPTQLTNATAIGANAVVGASNTIQLGNSSVTTVNVGTGTTAKLVAGQLQITGGTLGAGRVLTSDASGNATWQAGGGGGWGLTGNAGTVDGTNFIGTTDNIPFTIRVNNQRAGRIESATPFATFYGYQAGLNNGAAQANTAIGYQALTGITSAGNTAIGYQTLQNTSGGQNTAVGSSALSALSSGSGNTAVGQQALVNSTTTNFNTAVGLQTLFSSTGGSNAAFGAGAGQFNSSGQTNVFVGYQAGFPNATVANSNTTGSNNTFLGANTGLGSSTQRTNATAIGANARVDADNTIQLGDATLTTVNVGTGTTAKLVAGQLQITGGTLGAGRVLTSDASGNATWQAGGSTLISNPGTFNLFAGTGVSTASTDNAIFGANAGQNNTGPYNVIIGANAAINKTAGSLNTIVGWFAGKSISSPGDGNTLVGAQAGENTTANGLNSFFGEKSGQGNTTGGQNTFIGDRAGLANTTGSNNTMLGAYSNVGSVGLTNATAIGYQAQVNQSNSLVLGSINGVNGATTTVNVGIGTSTPINRLDVEGAVAIGATYAGTNAAPLNGAIVEGNVGIGTNNPSERLHIKEDIDSFIGLVIENTNTGTISTERISFNDENGSVAGIQVGDPTNAAGSVMSIFNNRPSSSMRLNVAGAARLTIANNGNITIPGALTKGSGTFKIDHPQDPENKYLYHSFVESPEMMNVYNGNVSTDEDGNATVALPSYFESLNKDFRYQLTVIGTFAQAIVMKEIEGNQFAIKTDKPNVKVSWQVTGVRKDPFAEKNRVVPEVEKPASEKGKYLHPEAYGLPLDRGVNHEPKKENN